MKYYHLPINKIIKNTERVIVFNYGKKTGLSYISGGYTGIRWTIEQVLDAGGRKINRREAVKLVKEIALLRKDYLRKNN